MAKNVQALSLVLFQRKLLFMPYLPPGSRSETLDDHKDHPAYKELRIEPLRVHNGKLRLEGLLVRPATSVLADDPKVLLCYLQGNGGNPLSRLAVFASIFRALRGHSLESQLSIAAVAPRSYWRSSRGPLSEPALVSDHLSVLRHLRLCFPDSRIVLYGHSLGAAAAVQVASLAADEVDLAGLVLEAPFASVPAMVRALYPQKWLPYRYLGPLVLDRFDTCLAASRLPIRLPLLVLQAAADELVPASQTNSVFVAASCADKKLVSVDGALHFNCFRRRHFAPAVRDFLQKVVRPLQPSLIELKLYVGGPECHLCLEAEEVLAQLQMRLQRRGTRIALTICDLRDRSPRAIEWRHRYGLRIPVLALGDDVIAEHRLSAAQLEGLLMGEQVEAQSKPAGGLM